MILSEENKVIPYEQRKNWEYYWCIDPIDGTKEFIKKNGDFTINIALIHKNTPILGVVNAPAINNIYYAEKGNGAYKNGKRIIASNNLKDKIKVVASKSHLNEETKKFINNLNKIYKNVELISRGSSLKFCIIAEGKADIYPRLAPTMEWDTAAADIIVREAGKMTYIYDNLFDLQFLNKATKMSYNKENLLNPYFVVI